MWRDQMQKGSFRGVAFRVKSQNTEGGRRVARHEYPGRDEPWPEDLGRKGRVHNIEMYIIGADYMAGRDAMLDALEKQGSAELTHPWLGALTVQVETYRLRESTREGGMATFSATFIEAGQRIFPSSSADTSSNVTRHSDAARLAVQQSFASTFSTAGQPGWVGSEAQSVLGQAADEINAVLQSVPGIPAEISTALADVSNLKSAISTLILTPLMLAGRIDGVISSISNIFTDPFAALLAYRGLALFGAGMPPVAATTPARIQQAANQDATVALVQQLALIAEANVSATYTPAASSDATSLRDDIADRLDSAATATADDASYLALTDLRSAVVSDITTRAITLPRVSHVTPTATRPALALAYQIYGDARRDSAIIDRNHVRHPGFVPGGQALEVLRA